MIVASPNRICVCQLTCLTCLITVLIQHGDGLPDIAAVQHQIWPCCFALVQADITIRVVAQQQSLPVCSIADAQPLGHCQLVEGRSTLTCAGSMALTDVCEKP